ncbi:hypothetical protein TorRG33x02_222310 [Trema orientale]|uniref:Uncharacterized protein n=1 Tax=Trema orientale TaxID=63057 RepID=A0A2P5E8Z3_TREOI|nr:hypothetical protein TorRG33x02_222310 [Trema orientale]
MEVFVSPIFGIELSSSRGQQLQWYRDLYCPERASSASSIGALDDNDDDSAALTTRKTPTTRYRAKFQGGSFSSLDSLEEFLLIK